MRRLRLLAWLIAIAALSLPQTAAAGQHDYDSLIATHAAANNVPEALVHRVILRESRYQPNLVGRCGCIGLMQIKLATARGLGYTGDAQGLRDPNTNLTYGVKYLAGAYRAANGDHNRTIHYFASGYYEVAKRQRTAEVRHGRVGRPLDITPKQVAKATVEKASVEKATVAKAPTDDQAVASEQVPAQ